MNIIKYKKIFVIISALFVVIAGLIIAIRGLDYGIEFTGGSVMEVSYAQKVSSLDNIRTNISSLGIESQVQPFGETSYIIKTGFLSEQNRKDLVNLVSKDGGSVERFNSIGPSVGKELRTKSLYALLFVSLAIVLFVAYAFRHVSEPVSSWRYGFVAVIALLHDLIIPVGILTLLHVEVDTLYVVGLLSILGLSVNDTIVVFDRIRENLAINNTSKIKESFDDTIARAVNDTFVRSLFTSLTLIVVLFALYFIGPVATRTLSLVLLLGTFIGTYSSIFLASPLLTYMVSKKKK